MTRHSLVRRAAASRTETPAQRARRAQDPRGVARASPPWQRHIEVITVTVSRVLRALAGQPARAAGAIVTTSRSRWRAPHLRRPGWVVVAAALSAAPLAAQTASPFDPGRRIRVWIPVAPRAAGARWQPVGKAPVATSEARIGTFLAVVQDTLLLAGPGAPRQAFPLAAVHQLEVGLGRGVSGARVRTGALLGAAAGAAAGAQSAAAGRGACGTGCSVPVAGLLGAAVGGALGAVVGRAIRGERWARASVPKPRMAPGRPRPWRLRDVGRIRVAVAP